jgi:hypothetical protein
MGKTPPQSFFDSAQVIDTSEWPIRHTLAGTRMPTPFALAFRRNRHRAFCIRRCHGANETGRGQNMFDCQPRRKVNELNLLN